MQKAKWVVAVSGGCDSMALLDSYARRHEPLIAAHVNYQKRETAARDMDLVRTYCETRQIPCFVRYAPKTMNGNFQAAARDFRYAFFKELMDEYQCEGVLVAHQLDDLIETYLIQKTRKQIPIIYGLEAEVQIQGMKIIRPLLDWTKADCRQYCIDHQIAFGDDESNFTDDYLRNRIRHHEVELMSDEQKRTLATAIKKLNIEKKKNDEQALAFVQVSGDELDVAALFEMANRHSILRLWLIKQGGGAHHSTAFIDSLFQRMQSHKNWNVDLPNNLRLYCDYGKLSIVDETLAYTYTYETLVENQKPWFKTAFAGTSLQAVTVSDDDFPITIRSPLEGDEITMRFGTKKLNRWFIDHKISHKERKSWPVVVNCVGKVILVPEIGCEVAHFSNKPNLFVIK